MVIDGTDQTPLAAPPRPYVAPRVSPNGRRLVVEVADRSDHIWVYDVAVGELKQLTFEASNRGPIWSPESARVTFSSNRNGALNLFVAPVDGTGVPERLTTSDSADGGLMVAGSHGARVRGAESCIGSQYLAASAGKRPDALGPPPHSMKVRRGFPHGQWIAYVSTESGQAEVFARSSSATGTARRISTGGGVEPVWRRDGGALYYRAQNRLTAVPVLDPGSLRLGPPRVVFDSAAEPGTFDAAGYDAMPGTDRFVMIASAVQNSPPTELQVTVNWAPAMPAQ